MFPFVCTSDAGRKLTTNKERCWTFLVYANWAASYKMGLRGHASSLGMPDRWHTEGKEEGKQRWYKVSWLLWSVVHVYDTASSPTMLTVAQRFEKSRWQQSCSSPSAVSDHRGIDFKVCHPRCLVKLMVGRVRPSVTQLEFSKRWIY